MKLFAARNLCAPLLVLAIAGCARTDHLGRAPRFSTNTDGPEHEAMLWPGLPDVAQNAKPVDRSSLWSGGQRSLLGDHRAVRRGDILTVVIEIDDKAEISNDTARSRAGNETLKVPELFGVPQRVASQLPAGASLANAVDVTSAGSHAGAGSVKRKEKLTLRVAATVVDVLPNGVLAIKGSQELRVNFELRELLVSGYVRPEDISRMNEITYDKIASARMSYGGRGQITDVQQPRYGQQILDMLIPF